MTTSGSRSAEWHDQRLVNIEDRIHRATMDVRYMVQGNEEVKESTLLALTSATADFVAAARKADEDRQARDAEWEKENEGG